MVKVGARKGKANPAWSNVPFLLCDSMHGKSVSAKTPLASSAFQLSGVDAMESISICMLVSMVAVLDLIEASDGNTRAVNSESCWLLE